MNLLSVSVRSFHFCWIVCQSWCVQTHKRTNTRFLLFSPEHFSLYLEILWIPPPARCLSACCLFIRQTICWSCVFFSACRPLGALLHVAVLYQLSDACGMPSVSHCPLHRHEVCVFTPGSLSASHRIIGRVRGSPLSCSPHHSFGELISSSQWPAIICSPVYFMAHFRISTSLYVQANLHLQQCLHSVISIAPLFLCSVPCKTIRLELWVLVITLVPCRFTV